MRFEPLLPIAGGLRKKSVHISRCIEWFKESGQSTHSTNGALCAPLLNWCVTNKVGFVLRYLPDGGYSVTWDEGPGNITREAFNKRRQKGKPTIRYVGMSDGTCTLTTETPSQILKAHGTENVKVIRNATEADLSWTKGMGGRVPDGRVVKRKEKAHD